MKLKKGEFAKKIGVSPASVSAYVAKGLPVLPDGDVDLDAGRAWVKANVAPTRGGWNRGNSAAALEKRTRGADAAADCPQLTGAEVVTLLNDKGIGLAVNVCKKLGLSNIQTEAAAEIISSWIDAALGDDAITAMFGECGAPFNRDALKQLRLTAAQDRKVDALINIALPTLGLAPIARYPSAGRAK